MLYSGSESRAAVAGGITGFMDMPNTQPPTTDHAALEAKRRIASRSAYANYAFYLGATNTNIEAVQSLDPQKTCGVKVFMGASTVYGYPYPGHLSFPALLEIQLRACHPGAKIEVFNASMTAISSFPFQRQPMRTGSAGMHTLGMRL